jgi:hypothetical protein
MRWLGLVAVLGGVALAVVLIAAAGGDGGGDTNVTLTEHPGVPKAATTPAITTATAAPGKARFVAAADDACTTYRGEIAPINRALNRELRGARDGAKMAVLLDRAAVVAEKAVGRIGALEPPRGDGATITAYLDSGREAARSLRGAAAALRAGQGERANRRIAEVRLASARGRTIAARYGFLVCGAPNPQAG